MGVFSGLAVALCMTSCETPLPPAPVNFDDRLTSADFDQDGEISADELADFTAFHLFYQRDANRDSKLTMQEWWPGADAIEQEAFKKRDDNDNGIMTLKEAREFARDNPEFEQTIRQADKDGDGKASWDEVSAWLKKH